MEIIDESNIIKEERYQCKECNQLMFGYQLLPIIHEILKDDPDHPYGVSGTGKFKCSIRRCCYCRGTVEKEKYNDTKKRNIEQVSK